MFYCRALTACALILSTAVLHAEWPAEVIQQVHKRIELGHHFAVVIGVVDADGPRTLGFGRVDPAGNTAPDGDSIFELGSVTKSYTAVLLADMQLRGEVDLQRPIDALVPSLRARLPDDGRAAPTLAQLLTHTAGLPREPANVDVADGNRYAHYSTADLLEALPQALRERDAQSNGYSNLGYVLIESVIESVAGEPFESLLQERVLKPLRLEHTHFTVPASQQPLRVSGFRQGRHTPALVLGEFQALGGLRASARDVLSYLAALAGLRSTPLAAAMHHTQGERPGPGGVPVGLSWSLARVPGSDEVVYYHKGGTPGFVAFAGFNPARRVGAVVLVSGSRYFSDIGLHLLDARFELHTVQ